MSKRIDFTNLGGNPIDQQSLEFMQASYRDGLAAVAALCGDKSILTGVDVIGGNVTSGWISLGGELIPFIGGGVAVDVIIEETFNTVTFQDQVERNIEFTKIAKCGSPGNFPFAELKKLSSLKNDRWQSGDIKMVSCSLEHIAANFDNAGIGINDRQGWRIYSDAAGRNLVGYNPNGFDFNEPGKTGGAKAKKITIANLPAHSFFTISNVNYAGPNNSVVGPTTYVTKGAALGDDLSYSLQGSNTVPTLGKTNTVGEGEDFSIMQPYLVTLVLIKI